MCVYMGDVLALEVLLCDKGPSCYPVDFGVCTRQGQGVIGMLLQNIQQEMEEYVSSKISSCLRHSWESQSAQFEVSL